MYCRTIEHDYTFERCKHLQLYLHNVKLIVFSMISFLRRVSFALKYFAIFLSYADIIITSTLQSLTSVRWHQLNAT